MTLLEYLQSIKQRKDELINQIDAFQKDSTNYTPEGLKKYKALIQENAKLQFEFKNCIKQNINNIDELGSMFNNKIDFKNFKNDSQPLSKASDIIYGNLNFYINNVEDFMETKNIKVPTINNIDDEMKKDATLYFNVNKNVAKLISDGVEGENIIFLQNNMLRVYDQYTIDNITGENEKVTDYMNDFKDFITKKEVAKDINYGLFKDGKGNYNFKISLPVKNQILENQNVSLNDNSKKVLTNLFEKFEDLTLATDKTPLLDNKRNNIFTNINYNYDGVNAVLGINGDGALGSEGLSKAVDIYKDEKKIIGELLNDVSSLETDILPLDFDKSNSVPVFTMFRDRLDDVAKLDASYEMLKFLKKNNIEPTKFLNDPIGVYGNWLKNYSEREIEKKVIRLDLDNRYQLLGSDKNMNEFAIDMANKNEFMPFMNFVLSLDPSKQLENSKKLKIVTDVIGGPVVKEKLLGMKDKILDSSKEEMRSFLLGSKGQLRQVDALNNIISHEEKEGEIGETSYFERIKEAAKEDRNLRTKDPSYYQADGLIQLKSKIEKDPSIYGSFSKEMLKESNNLLKELVNYDLRNKPNMMDICRAVKKPAYKMLKETHLGENYNFFDIVGHMQNMAMQEDVIDKNKFMSLVNPILILEEKYNSRWWITKWLSSDAKRERELIQSFKEDAEKRGVDLESVEEYRDGKISLNELKEKNENCLSYINKETGEIVNETNKDSEEDVEVGDIDELLANINRKNIEVDSCKEDNELGTVSKKHEKVDLNKSYDSEIDGNSVDDSFSLE